MKHIIVIGSIFGLDYKVCEWNTAFRHRRHQTLNNSSIKIIGGSGRCPNNTNEGNNNDEAQYSCSSNPSSVSRWCS